MKTLKFKIILRTDAILPYNIINDGLFIPGSFIKGALRNNLRNILNISSDMEESILGSINKRAKVFFTDINSEDSFKEVSFIPQIKNEKNRLNDTKYIKVANAGSVLTGEITYDEDLTENELLILKSTILELETSGIGSKRNLGYGFVKIEFYDKDTQTMKSKRE